MRFLSGTLEVMRLGTTGNVGIGGAPLTLSGNAAPGLTVSSNGPFILLQDANNADKVTYISNNTGDLQFGIVGDDGATGKTEHMRIDGATGNVGIGATTVNRALEIAGNNNAGAKANYIRITDTDTTATANNQAGGIEFFTNDVTPGIAASIEVLYAGTGGGGEITFNTNASSSGTLTEALRIDESGNVGIGTSTPDTTLHLQTPSGTKSEINFAQTAVTNYRIGVPASTDALVFTYGASTERMRIDSSGIITTPYQPAFLANATGQDNIPISANTTVTFGAERFDQGGNFASSTFTAPVTGAYQLNVNIYAQSIDSAADYVQISLKTTLREYYYIFSTTSLDQDAAYMSFPISVLANMDEGDTAHVEVQLNNTGTAQMDINAVSSFSGYLAA
jgi:hypothetical protein